MSEEKKHKTTMPELSQRLENNRKIRFARSRSDLIVKAAAQPQPSPANPTAVKPRKLPHGARQVLARNLKISKA